MADELGTAVLRLELSTDGLKEGLTKAKQQIETSLGTSPLSLNTKAAQQQFQQLQQTAKTLETQIKALNSTPLNLNRSSLKAAGDEFSRNVKVINDFTRGVINGDRALGNSIASIQQQSRAFSTLAANVKIGTAEFVNFTQAAAKASQKQLFAGFEEISALQKLFQSGGSSGITDSFKGTEQLLAFSSKIGQTPAAINLYVSALEQALSVTKTTDVNFAKLTSEIERQAAALAKATNAAKLYSSSFKQPQLALPPGKGPSQFVFQGPSAQDIANEQRNLRRQQKIAQRIDYFSTGGASPADPGLLARPNLEAIRQERDLATARKRTAAETAKTQRTERQSAQQRAKLTKDVAANALIGVGFPLLFGQGVGAAAGGGIGGALGALGGGSFGFAGSIAGTALGTAFDTALQKGVALADGLEDPIKNFDGLREAALLSSKALEKQVETLIKEGRTLEAAALIREDLTKVFGDVEGVKQYTKATDELNRSWSKASVVLANFTAGPLTEFINRISSSLQAGPVANQLRNRLQQLTPEQRREAELFRLQRGPELLPGRGGFSNTTYGDERELLQLNLETLKKIDEITGKTRSEEERSLEVQKQKLNVLRAQGDSVVAQALGIRELAASASLREVQGSIRQEFPGFQGADPEQQRAIARQLNEEQLQRLNDLRKQEFNITAQLARLDTERSTKNENLNRSLQNTLNLIQAQSGKYRETLNIVQSVQDKIVTASQQRDLELGDINLAQQALGPTSPENIADFVRLEELRRQVNTQFADVTAKGKLDLIEAGESLRDNLRSAVLEFTRIRSDAQGLNRFLSPGRQNLREREDFRLLLPSFREAQGRFAQLTGTRAPEFRGSTRNVNETVRDFIATVDREFQARQTVGGAQQSLQKINEELVSVNTQLSEATNRLAAKDWNVSVNVVNNADGSRTVNAINGLTS